MDDLVQHYRMVKANKTFLPGQDPFIHLDVEACFRTVPWSIPECLTQVTPKGRPRSAYLRRKYLFTPLGFLQLCLFGCKPFHGLTERQIRDARRGVPLAWQLHAARHRPRLLDEMASALWEYERWHHVTYTWPRFVRERDRTAAFLQSVPTLLTRLRQREIPLADPILRHQHRSLINVLEQAADILSRIQPEDYYHAGGAIPPFLHRHIRPITRVLVLRMAKAFQTYGPPTFTQVAMHHAICAILTPLRILNERGNLFTAANVKALLRRSTGGMIIDDPWGQMTGKTPEISASVSPEIFDQVWQEEPLG